jgi:uncharacterized protein YuzE
MSTTPMLVTYDPQADAAYIYFDGYPKIATQIDTVKLNAVLLIDFDRATGKAVGLEVLDAAGILPEGLLASAERP